MSKVEDVGVAWLLLRQEISNAGGWKNASAEQRKNFETLTQYLWKYDREFRYYLQEEMRKSRHAEERTRILRHLHRWPSTCRP